MIYPMSQFPVSFGAAPVSRRELRQQRRHSKIVATAATSSPTPYTNTGPRILATRATRKLARKHGLAPDVLPLPTIPDMGPMQDVSNGSARKRHKQDRKAKRIDGGGGLPLPKGGGGGLPPVDTQGGPCSVTQTLGSCLQCCSHTLQGAKRRACKRACDLRFSGGGGGDQGGGGGSTLPPSPQCGIVCVSGTHGNQQDCHYECYDYGTPPTPTTGGPSQSLPISYPDIGGAQVAGPEPTTEPPVDLSFWDQYKTPLLIGGAAVALVLILHKKKGGR